MISLRSMAQRSSRQSAVANDPRSSMGETPYSRVGYSSGAAYQQTQRPARQTMPVPSFTMQNQMPNMLSESRTSYEPFNPLPNGYGERRTFPAAEMQPQINSFFMQLRTNFLKALLMSWCIAIGPILYFMRFRLWMELSIFLLVLLYVKIREPQWRDTGKLYYPVLVLFFATYFTDFVDDIELLSAGSIFYSLPSALFLMWFKWKELSTNEFRIVTERYQAKLAMVILNKTLKDVCNVNFLRGVGFSLAVGSMGAYIFTSVADNTQYLSASLALLAAHVIIVYTINVICEVDLWLDVADEDYERTSNNLLMSFWILRLEDQNYQHEQDRAVKHANRLVLQHKCFMHIEIGKNSFGQRRNWDLFLRFASYRLDQVNSTINSLRSRILHAQETVRSNKGIIDDLFIHLRKLNGLVDVSRLQDKVENEIASTYLIYDTLVKAISYSRSGVEQTALEEISTLPSRIRSITQTTTDIFQREPTYNEFLTKYTAYCSELLGFLQGYDVNKRTTHRSGFPIMNDPSARKY